MTRFWACGRRWSAARGGQRPHCTLSRLSIVLQAIRLYTINNAYLTFDEKDKGSLETGKLADFIVLDRDILTCPINAIKDIEVRETWLGGQRVFARK